VRGFVRQYDEDGNEFRRNADVGNGGSEAVDEKPLARLMRRPAPIKAKDDGLCIFRLPNEAN